MKTKTIGRSDRTWASKRFQSGLGQFQEDACGIYLSTDIKPSDRSLVVGALLDIPEPLLDLARDYELTLNVASLGCTVNQNVCTIYGNWGASTKEAVSVHLEIGRQAFGINLKPFLIHELCHLWWRTRSIIAQSEYRQFLIETTGPEHLEVTFYAHSKFEHYLSRVNPEDGGKPAPHPDAVDIATRIWVEESFCETVAKLSVPHYKSDEDWQGSVDLGRRSARIEELTDLNINLEESWN